MGDKAEDLLEALFEAIKAEVEGYHFYLMAARSTQDPTGKEVFELLANEELEHQRFLKKQYRHVLDNGRADPELTLGRPATAFGESRIFSPEIKDRIGEAHFEVSALSIGIQLELSSIEFYREAARSVDDPTVRSFLEDLVRWEEGHYQALLRQQQSLKEDYWSTSGFSPF